MTLSINTLLTFQKPLQMITTNADQVLVVQTQTVMMEYAHVGRIISATRT